MTQIELPQVSLQRYVDLLRRRRWQVIPASLLGLMVGGIIAFFIPRYYVADTLIEHQQVPGEVSIAKDPVKSIVDTAKQTLPLAIGETIEGLGWSEWRAANAYERAQFERDVRQRLFVNDINPDRDRSYAQLRVTFRDLEGNRAATFLNALVQTWKRKRLDELRQAFERDQQQAKLASDRHNRTFEAAQQDRRSLELTYRIDPQLSIDMQQKRADEDRQKLLEVRETLLENVRKRTTAQRALELDQDKLASIPPRVPATPLLLAPMLAAHPEGAMMIAKISMYRAEVERYRETTGEYARAKRELEKLEQQLLMLLGPSIIDAQGMIANPLYEALAASVRKQQSQLAELDLEIEQGQRRLTEENQRLDDIVGAFSRYENRVKEQKQAEQDRDAARKQWQDADTLIGRLSNEQTIKIVEPARQPPRPTEPNILIVALIGCVLGLAFAVALILLLDVLQGSFKSIEDVEDGLRVPVLGGMSHLETEAERQRAIRTRRRTTVAAAAFLGLCVALVLLFYADPTRLPPVVRDLLALLLGA